MALHLVCVEVGACGMRWVCLFLHVTGLNRFVAASYGAQQQVNVHVEPAIVSYRPEETARLARDMPPKELTGTQDDTFPGGLCLIPMEPESNCMMVEQLAQAGDQRPWDDLMAPALAPLNCRGIQSTSDEAPGLLASVEHSLEAHHAPALFHGQPELVRAGSGPMATKERAAHKAVINATEQLQRLHSDATRTGDEPDTGCPGRPSQDPMSLEPTTQALEGARREPERLTTQRAQVKASIRGIGPDSPFVELDRGVRRHGPLLAADLQEHIEQIRPIAQQEGRSQHGLERIEKAERGVPKMRATSNCVSGYGGRQVAQLDVTPPVSFAMHAKLIPSYDLDRVAETRTLSAGAPLRALAERLRAPLFAADGVLSTLSPEAQARLPSEAKRLAAVFQRSSSNVEGRNGYLSLRSHQLRGLDLPRKRECFTTIHPFFLTRPDGTTAAERFFGQKPRSMFAVILDAVELAPAPLSPPRRA
jgi:hypothetical protein